MPGHCASECAPEKSTEMRDDAIALIDATLRA